MLSRINLIILLLMSILFLALPNNAKLPKIQLDSDTIANIAETVSKSVVNIDTTVEVKEADIRKKSFNFGGIGFNLPDVIQPPESGTGSGVVFKKDGYILTNYHVVKKADKIFVTFKDERKFEGKLISHDSYSDLAIVKIEAMDLPVAIFGDSKELRPGDWVLAIGSPLGLEHTVTLGIISALSRHVGVTFGAAQGAYKYIQTDAPINPGNSGGPLVNLIGEVIGINTFIIGRNAQNLNFAIPADYAKKVAEELISSGSIKHPYLGIKTSFLDETQIKAEGVPKDTKGIYVVEVVPNSPSQTSGILPGDIIQKVEGTIIEDPRQIADMVRTKKVGEKLHIKLLRDTQVKVIEVTIGDLPEEEGIEAKPSP